MSTRFYPRFVKGNPQLRIFLPDWKLIMVKPKYKLPDNVVAFKVDPRMTNWDIKNYLEKIYKVQVGALNSYIQAGPLSVNKDGLSKGDDYRIAHVTLPIGQKFEWPDLFPKGKKQQELSDFESTMEQIKKGRRRDPHIKNIPSWFG